ncbi:MAG: transglycosylase SLT domain-containing protein, partial [Gammaproteobacteria bacterium]
MYRHFVDDLQAEPLGLAFTFRWGFNGLETDELFAQAESYIQEIQETGAIDELQARFFWNNPALNDIERRVFLERISTRLPQYMAEFKQAAKSTHLDWRLLAAMAYQESHWNPKAISPTGVRGMMMLTRATAREVGVTDRHSASSSIRGGAIYFMKQKARLPTFIPEPDRTWMSLAAYNLGTHTVLNA